MSKGKQNFLFLTSLIVVMLSSPALSIQYIEDFEDDFNPDQPGFANTIFQHTILPPEGGQHGDENWFFSDVEGHQPWVFFLDPGIDEITFSLEPGQYVDYVSVNLLHHGGKRCRFRGHWHFGNLLIYGVPLL